MFTAPLYAGLELFFAGKVLLFLDKQEKDVKVKTYILLYVCMYSSVLHRHMYVCNISLNVLVMSYLSTLLYLISIFVAF